MSRKLILTLVVLVGLAAGSARAELLASYPFSEGQGTATADVTGNGNDGTFNGDVEWVAGYQGRAVRFDTAGERIVIGPLDPSAGTNAMTLAAWINWEGSGGSIAQQGIIGKRQGWDPGTAVKWFWQTNPAGDLLFRADSAQGGDSFGWGNALLVGYANEWVHVAMTWDNGAGIQYINAEEVSTGNVGFIDTADDTPMTIGCVQSDWNETFLGIIDEVQIHNVALMPAGLQKVMTGDVASSSSPFPPDAATDVRRDVVLSWEPGEYAATHDVYLGTDADAVAAADATNPMGVLVSPGQAETSYDSVALLDFGQTYYWRVAEVNAPPDGTVFPGTVWSFTTEPVLYEVQGVVATASIPTAAGSGQPSTTVNGSGLTAGAHGTGDATMWSGVVTEGETPWIQFDFDGVYKLFGIHIWNYNGLYEFLLGFGFKDVTIEYASEPNEWTTLGDFQLARATNQPSYAGERLDLAGVAARSVRISANSTHGGRLQAGLSEIRFFYKPVEAREPQPAPGTTGVNPAVTLSWRPGREAASHQVQFSTDPNAVAGGAALVDTVAASTFSPGSLNLGTSYFWRIDEVNEATTPSVWASDVWDFTTTEYVGIEDFESYTDDEGNRIYETWLDGYDVATNGSLVGHDAPPYAEQAIRYGGRQSMPLYYDNTAPVANSETERSFMPAMDLTANGADVLSLYYRGVPPAFLELPSGSIVMNGIGSDIYNTVDQFRFAYKQLTGDGSITVRVDRIDDVHEWAKAGVMIRTGLGTVPLQAHMIASPRNRVEWQYRPTANGNTTQVSTAIDSTPLPYWVRIARQGGTITGQRSADGQTWVPITVGDPASSTTSLTLAEPVYIGLVVSSHVADTPCGVEFSNVSTTGNVSAGWQLADVGADQVAGNGIDAFYLAVQDSSGRKATLVNPDPYAVGAGAWTQWIVPLSDLSAAGVNTRSVSKIYLGVGDKTKPSQNASGVMYIDDIVFGHPAQ